MGRRGTPAHVEPEGSFAPPERSTGSEAAGSAAASTTPEEAEAAGSAAAKRPRGREGRGRAGKHVNKKLEKKSYYEAQDLYRAYWGVRGTRRVPFEEASDEYFDELLDHYNWHYSLGRYKPEAVEEEEEAPVEVEVEVEDPVGAGSAAPDSAEVVTGREFLGEQPVVLTPRQPEYPPPTPVEEDAGASSSRRPATPPVLSRSRKSSSIPPASEGAGRAAPVTRARSEEPVVEERRRRRKRRTSGETRGRAAEEVHRRRPPSPPTPRRSRSVALEERVRQGRPTRPVVENLPGIPTPEQQSPTTYRVDRRGVWQLIRPAAAATPAPRLVEVRPEGAGRAAPAADSPDPFELADEVWTEPQPENRRRVRGRDALLVHRDTEVHNLAAGDDRVLQGSFAVGEVIEAEEAPVAETVRRDNPYNTVPEPKRQRRNYTFFENKNPSNTWFDGTSGGAGSAAPSSGKAASIAPPPPPPGGPPRKDPPKPKVGHKKPPPPLPSEASSSVGGGKGAPRDTLPDSDPRLFPDRAFKHPPPELHREVQGAGSAASGPPPEPRFTPLGLDRTYGHPQIAPRCTEPIRVCLDYHNVLDLHEVYNRDDRRTPYTLDVTALEYLSLTAEQFNVAFDILSFVKGDAGVRYVTPRINSIAQYLRSQGLQVREAAVCFNKCGSGGKAEWCYRNICHAILDDSPDIIRDCEGAGIFAVQVDFKSGSIKNAIYKLRARLQECTHEEFLRKYAPR